MNDERLNTIEKAVNEYRLLPPDKKMFVLGFMQGVLSNYDDYKNSKNQLQETK